MSLLEQDLLPYLGNGAETTRLLTESANLRRIQESAGSVTFQEVQDALVDLEGAGFVERFCDDARPCWHDVANHPNTFGPAANICPQDLWWELTPAGIKVIRVLSNSSDSWRRTPALGSPANHVTKRPWSHIGRRFVEGIPFTKITRH